MASVAVAAGLLFASDAAVAQAAAIDGEASTIAAEVPEGEGVSEPAGFEAVEQPIQPDQPAEPMEPVEELAPVESANEVADPQNGPSSSELALDTTEEKVSEAKLEVAPSTRASLNAQESPAPQVKPYAAPEESGAEQPVEDQTGQDKNVTTEAEIAANWKSQPKDTNQWALAEDQNIVRISGSDPIKMTDISYGGAFIDESGRTNLRLIYSEASTANSIWARALFNFGELSQYIDYEQSKIHGKSRGPYTLEKFNNTEIGQLNIQDPAMIRASNRSNLPINIVLKEGVDLTTLADKNYPIEMRVTDIDFKRVYAHAPGDSALDYTTYTKSTIIPIKDQISSHFLKGGFQPASKDIARQKSFMTEFIANPEQYNDLSNTGILRTQYYSNRMFAKQKPTMYGEEAAYTQIFDAKLLNYMKEDDKGNVAYVNVLTDAKKVSPYSQNVAITRDMINQTPDGKYAYLVIGPEGFNRDGVKVVNIPKHDQYTILEGFYFTAIDYVIDKEKISADPTMVNENKIDFAVASGFTNPNKAGWVHYENTVSQDTIISKGDAIFIDVGEKPAQDQIMVQIGDDKYNFVHTTHGYYNGSYDTDAANFAQITKSSKDGLYKLTFNEGRTLKAGQEIKVYLPYDSEGQPSIHLGQPIINNATEENEGAATLSIEPDGNIRLKMFSAGQGLGKKDGSFKLIYTPRGGNQQEAINFTKNGIKTFWQNDDKNDVLISSNTATTTSGGLYFIKTDKLELGEDVVVEAYSPEGNKIEEWTTILTDKAYSLVDRNENYKGLTWVDQTNTSSVGSIIKSLYVPYQEIFTNDYAKGTDDFYVNPNVAPAKASDFMKNTTNIIGYTKYDGGDVRLRYINPQQITYIGKTQAAANEYDSDGNISKDRTIEVTINGETFSAFAYDIDLSQLSELRAPGSGSAPKLYKDMKLLFNASDGSSLPSNTVEARVRTRVLFDATDGKLADGESAVRVVPDNVKYYGEEGYVANGFAGDNIQAGTGDSFVADPTAEGKTFLGWVTAEGKTALGDKTTVLSKDFNALDGAHKFTDKTPVGSHQVVYAIWSEEALVKFDANGGSFTDATSTKTDDINDGIQEPEAPSQEGKTFKGWATTADATTPDVDLANIDQPTTIYAVWEDVTPEETNLELVNPEPTPVQNPAQLSEAEKTAVDAAVRQANPDLPADAVITVGDTGEVTVTSGNKTGTIPSAQTVVEDTALDLTPPTAVEVQDPTQLTADEKTAVEEAVRQANPDLPTDATIEVADNGEVTVTSGNKTGSLSADKTVTEDTTLDLVEPATTEVQDPTQLTADEKTAVEEAVRQANPDLPTDATIEVADNGEVTVTSGNKSGTIPSDQAVVEDTTLDLTPPTAVEVQDPTQLTADEKAAVEAAVRQANPDLPADAVITVADNGAVTVTDGNKTGSLSADKTVVEDTSLDLVAPATTEVQDPTQLTADEKAAVEEAVRQANPDLPTDATIEVADNGEVTITSGNKTGSLSADKTVTEDTTLDLVEPATTEVQDPSQLTADEKAAVEAAVRQANPDLPADAVVTVADNGEVTVTSGNKSGSLPSDQTVVEDTTLNLTAPTAVEVQDPTQLTADEKAAVEAAVRQANPDLPADAVVTVADNGEVTVTSGIKSGSLPSDQTVVEDTTLNLTAPTAVEVQNPSQLTADEKTAVEEAVRQANPDLPSNATIEVADNGEVTVTSGNKTGSLPSSETVVEDTTLDLTPPTAVEVQDPTQLTADEKTAVEEAVRQANPDLPTDATIEVADNGAVTVTSGNKTGSLSADKTVTEDTTLDLVAPATTEVQDPTQLTADEKSAVEAAVRQANPDLPADAVITVGDNGDVTVTSGNKSGSLPSAQTVVEDTALDLTPPTAVEVQDPTQLTADEKVAVEEAVRQANPELPADAVITVGDNGDVTVTSGNKTGSLPSEQTVVEDTALDLTPPTAVEVQDPAHLTADEKTAVEEAVRQANPDLPTDATIEVADNGEVTVTSGNKTGSLPSEQTVVEDTALDLTPPTAVEVQDPAHLTADEKTAVEEAVRQANPDLPTDATIEVADNGEVTVTSGNKSGSLPSDQTVVEDTTLNLTAPTAVEVQDPTQLTADEKAAVEAAVRQANPDLPADAVVTVADNGEVTVTSGNKSGSLPSEQTVVEDTTLNLTAPTAVEVQNPSQLTADEKTAVEEAVRQANPDLPSDATIEVADNGEVTVTSGNKTGSLSADKTVAEDTSLDLVAPATTEVQNPSQLTADEKAAVEEAVRQKNPGLSPDAVVTVADNGEVTVTDGNKTGTIPSDQAVVEDTTLELTVPTAVEVQDLAQLTADEKAAVEEAVRQSNPDLPSNAVITVGDNGDVTVTSGNKTGTIPSDQTVVEDTALDLTPPTAVEVQDPAQLTADEKAAVEEAVRQSNPDLPSDAVITVGDNGDVTVTSGNKTGSLPSDQTVVEDTTLDLAAPTAVEVQDPTQLTADEKAAVKEAVRQANPDLPSDATIEVADNGEVTVTSGNKTGSLSADKTVAEDTSLDLVAPATTEVQNPSQLTANEKAAVEEAVRQANPGLSPDAVVTVADIGEVTVTDGNKTGTIPSDQAVVEDTTLELTVPTAVEVQDPTQLTADEKSAVEEAVRQANPDLPSEATIEVADNGEVTVTVGDKTGNLSSDQTVVEDTALDLTAPTAVEVQDPAHLTDAEKSAVEEAVRQANPDLPSEATIEVADNGEVTVTVGNKTGSLPSDQVVTSKVEEDTNLEVNQPAKTAVQDPSHLTDAEKSAVEEAVRQANPDLPSNATIEVADNGEVTVTVGDKTGNLPSDQVVTGKEKEDTNLVVNQPTKTEVEDPAHLTDAEKSAVEEAVRQANPDLPSDAVITVSDNGEVTVTVGDKTGTLPSDQVVTGKVEEGTNLEVNQPAKTEVEDPAHLTDAEKSAVEEAVRQANPDLPSDATIEVSDNGEVTVTAGDKTGNLPSDQVVTGKVEEDTNLEVNQPAKTEVQDPSHLTDAEKSAVEEAVRQANPDLPSDATIEVSDNGEVTVTVGDKTGTISPANTVEQAGMTVDKSALETEQGKETSVKESDAYKKADPVKQAAYDKALEEASNILADPNATQAQVDQALKVLEEARADLNGQASESGKLNLPAVTTVTDPAHLTPAEQAAIKEAIRQANPNLADAMIVVHPNGSATVTIDGQEITLTADQLVVRRAADAGQAANTDASKPATDATQASQASIKQVAQDPAVTTGQASQVAESQTTSQDSQASDLPATGETTSYGALGAAILSILSGIGLIAPRKKEEE